MRDRGNPVGPTKIAIRPEAVVLAAKQPSAPSLSSRVIKAAYLGSHMEYTIESPIGPLFVVDANVTTPFEIGAAVHATLAPLVVTIIPN